MGTTLAMPSAVCTEQVLGTEVIFLPWLRPRVRQGREKEQRLVYEEKEEK